MPVDEDPPPQTRRCSRCRGWRDPLDFVDALRAAQGHRCAICERHEDQIPWVRLGRPRLDGQPTAPPVKLVVDHCHRSRRIRGLFCFDCNSAIGHFRDDERTVRAALAYLRRQSLPLE